MRLLSACLIMVSLFLGMNPQLMAEMPVEKQKEQEKIVINIEADGAIMVDKVIELQDAENVTRYIAHQRKRIEAKGLIPVLYLKGGQEALFKHSRVVIKCAAQEGVHKVVFDVVAKGGEKPAPIRIEPSLLDKALGGLGIRPKPRDSDLNLALPAPANEQDLNGDSLTKILIQISADGKISVDGKAADVDLKIRKLPLLDGHLKRAVNKHPDGAAGLRVAIAADGDAKQQRVIDVLNALASANINSVTFEKIPDQKPQKKPSSPGSSVQTLPR